MDNLLCGTACGVFIIHVLNLTGNGVQKEIDSVVKIRGWLFPHLKKMSKDFSRLLVSSNLKNTGHLDRSHHSNKKNHCENEE